MEAWSILFVVMGFLITPGDSRQKCWACQWQTNAQGSECLTDPALWTGGQSRMNCPELCRTEATFNSKGKPTFILRSCGYFSAKDKNGCTRSPTMDTCIYTCGDGDYYCNDRPLPISPFKDPNHNSASKLSMGFLSFTFNMILHLVVSGHLP